MKFKDFWKANKKSYFIASAVVIFLGIFGYMFQCSRDKAPINLMEHLSWSLVISPMLVFIFMCGFGLLLFGGKD